MTDPSLLEPDVHDQINELTTWHTHRADYSLRRGHTTITQRHTTTVPPLIHMLIGNQPAGSKTDAGSAHGRSKPAARIEAIDTVMLIDHEAAAWVRRLGENDPGDILDRRTGQSITGTGTIRCITRVHALLPNQPNPTQHRIRHDVRRWWRQARIMTGFDWVYRPFNTCPTCEQRGTLRILVELKSGMCVECRSVWSPEDFHRLTDHIRTENDTPDEPDAA